MVPKLGEFLVKRGAITDAQVRAVLEAQRGTGKPFGLLAEEMFGVDPSTVVAAWTEQYELWTGTVQLDDERPQEAALRTLTSRQAWQFRVLPLSFELRTLRLCTDRASLPRALRFCCHQVGPECYFVLTSAQELDRGLRRYFPMDGAERLAQATA